MKRLAVVSAAVVFLSGCGNALDDVDRLSDADLPADAPAAAVAATTEPTGSPGAATETRRSGFLGGIFAPRGLDRADGDIGATPQASPAEPAPVETAAAPPPDTAPRGGLLGFLRRQSDQALAAQPVSDNFAPDNPAPVIAGPDGALVTPGATVPYGQVARLCGVPVNRLGKRTDRYPERGSARYTLYDTEPGATGLRTMYLTGFDDGCARQFSAALAVFGGFEMHERLRYGLPDRVQPYSETDDAYETLKRQVCGAGRGKPCGSRMAQFQRDGVFVSVYERFTGSPRWKNLLLHDGRVVAFDVTGN